MLQAVQVARQHLLDIQGGAEAMGKVTLVLFFFFHFSQSESDSGMKRKWVVRCALLHLSFTSGRWGSSRSTRAWQPDQTLLLGKVHWPASQSVSQMNLKKI